MKLKIGEIYEYKNNQSYAVFKVVAINSPNYIVEYVIHPNFYINKTKIGFYSPMESLSILYKPAILKEILEEI